MTICMHLVETHQRHIPTKFEVNLADGFREEVKNVNELANPIDFTIPIDLHGSQ